MIVDGKSLAGDLKQELKEKLEGENLVLAVVLVGDDQASKKFVERKIKFGAEVGVEVRLFEYENTITEDDLGAEVEKLANKNDIHGIVIQLPLSKQINPTKILNLIPADKDVDALSENASVLAPVAGAVKEILERHSIDLADKKILVVGQGKLVGRPVAIWLVQESYDVETADINTSNLIELTLGADVIISGVGKPGLIKPEMVKDGVVLIDAGTSEQGGKLAGDADSDCADKCALFTPVPGGVGPITVAMIFKNLAQLQGFEK